MNWPEGYTLFNRSERARCFSLKTTNTFWPSSKGGELPKSKQSNSRRFCCTKGHLSALSPACNSPEVPFGSDGRRNTCLQFTRRSFKA